MEQKLTILDCVKNIQYELKVMEEIFDSAKTDTMFATQLLEFCKNKECFVFDRPMPAYDQRYDSKGIGKERNDKDDNNKSIVFKEYQLEFLDANITNSNVWVKIAMKINETLSQQGLPLVAQEKCKTKWETLKHRYKILNDSQKNSGSAPMIWSFYDKMEEVFSEQPWVKPLTTAGSTTTNKMDPDVISPPRKQQKTLTNYCEELLAAKRENSEIRQKHHRETIASIAQLSGALNKLVDHLTKRHGDS